MFVTLQPPVFISTSRSIRLEPEHQTVTMSEWSLLTASEADEHTLFRGTTYTHAKPEFELKTLKIASDTGPRP